MVHGAEETGDRQGARSEETEDRPEKTNDNEKTIVRLSGEREKPQARGVRIRPPGAAKRTRDAGSARPRTRLPAPERLRPKNEPKMKNILDKCRRREALTREEAYRLYDEAPLPLLARTADEVRRSVVPDPGVVTWQIDRNVNITKIGRAHV